jgi:type IV pilus assembly protein PilE
MSRATSSRGFTLIELMIVVAVLSVIAAIAVPAYNGYIREARLGAARTNIEPLRLALEDYWLDNSTYADVDGLKWDPANSDDGLYTGNLGWKPDGDEDRFKYEVTASTNSYTITVTHYDLPSEGQVFSK